METGHYNMPTRREHQRHVVVDQTLSIGSCGPGSVKQVLDRYRTKTNKTLRWVDLWSDLRSSFQLTHREKFCCLVLAVERFTQGPQNQSDAGTCLNEQSAGPTEG